MELLDTIVQPYAWGSTTALPALLGREPTGEPQAELWMGAHPQGPSRLTDGATLGDAIAADPVGQLGQAVVGSFGPRLPFLLKVLAADQPLSLQAHPDPGRARAGFEREDAAGIPRDAPHRSYRDTSHKPELLCALGPFDALCGFRPVAATLELVEALDEPALADLVAPLAAQPGPIGLRTVVEHLLTLAPDDAAPLVATVAGAAARLAAADGPWAAEATWTTRLAGLHPTDSGVVTALLLNLVHLEAGEAIHLPAGNLHAYLGGTGVEIMASSDNVLRGGLTPKHVDVAELLAVLDTTPLEVEPLRPVPVDEVEARYPTPDAEFGLSVLTLTDRPAERDSPGPEILLCTAGRATVSPDRAHDTATTPVVVEPGRSVWVPAADARYRISGPATVFRARVGLLSGP